MEMGAGLNNMGEVLQWDLGDDIEGRPARLGGIKFHLYNIQPISGKCLTMCITQQGSTASCRGQTLQSCFFTSLNFKGWRAVWVSYDEFWGCQDSPSKNKRCFERGQIEKFTIEVPKSVAQDPVYLDDLKFVDKIDLQTRDRIVPPVRDKNSSCFTCPDLASGIQEEDAI